MSSLSDRIQSRLNDLDLKPATVAKEAGLKPDYIRDILRGSKKSISADHAATLARVLQCSLSWLLTGDHDHIPSEEVAAWLSPHSHEHDSAYAREFYKPRNPGGLPELDASLGAGNGQAGEILALPMGGEAYVGHRVVAEWLLPEGFIRNVARASASNTVILPVIGDSMLPSYSYGDRVMVDLAQNTFAQDGVYAISDGMTEPRIKRLHYVFNSNPRRVRIISDNPIYAPEEHLLDDVKIIGRVCGVMAVR